MKRCFRASVVSAFIAFLAVLVPAQLTMAQSGLPKFVPGQVILKFKPHATPSEKVTIKQELRGRTLRRLSRIDAELLAVEGVTVEEAINRYKAHGKIQYIEPNYIVRASVLPNDALLDQLWGMRNTGQTAGAYDADIDAEEAWDTGTGSRSILVGVLDTGVDYRHPDLAANMWTNPREFPNNQKDDDRNGYVDDFRGWDFCNDDNDPMDDHGHGTHVSGTIGAVGNNVAGVVGVCWQVTIVPIKFLNSKGNGTDADAIAALEYAAGLGVKIANCSWGDPNYSQAVRDAVADAYAAGMLLIASAGNRQENTDLLPQYPACFDAANVVSVAATNQQDNLAWFSNWGRTTVDLGAPGIDILSTLPGNSYGLGMGTSMAAPHVTGTAALIWSLHPDMAVDTVKARLLEMADPVPGLYRRCVTGARLNAARSAEGPDNVPPAAITTLVANNPGSNSIRLSWTAPGDDGMAGTASSYQVRYSVFPITEENFYDATRSWNEPVPRPYGSLETAVVSGLEGNTTYYFAVKAYDNRGNESPISNLAIGSTVGPPDVAGWPEFLSEALPAGCARAQTFTLRNTGEGALDFAVTGTHITFAAGVGDELAELGMVELDPRTGHATGAGSGGPDAFGYRWLDSDQPGGPLFDWADITSVGTQIPMNGANVNTGSYPIGFYFQFYGETFNTFRVCSNGFISFTSSSTFPSNKPLPSTEAPENLIAAWWDNLYVGEGHVFYHNDGTRLIVEFCEVTGSGSGGPYTFEVILYPTGTIVLQYLTMSAPWTGATVGIQDAGRKDGLQVVCDAAYVHNNLAVRFTTMPKWLTVSPSSGVIPAGGSQVLTATFKAPGLASGDYDADIMISSNDPDEPIVTVPSHMHVTAAPDIAVGGEVVHVASTRTYMKSGASTDHILESSVPAVAPGSLSVEVSGDYGDPTEYSRVTVEGVLLGTLASSGDACDTVTRDFALDPDQLEGLLADGAVNVTVLNSNAVDASCGDSRHTVALTYRRPVDMLDFGKVFIGLTDTMRVYVENVGTDILRIASVRTDDPEFLAWVSSWILAPGASTSIAVAFAPTLSGSRTATLTIETNDPDESLISIPLLVERVTRPMMIFRPDRVTQELPSGQSGEQRFAIVNGGGADLHVDLSLGYAADGMQAGIQPTAPSANPILEDVTSGSEAYGDSVFTLERPILEAPGVIAVPNVLLVQHHLPWGYSSNQVVLGWEGLTYEIVTPEQLASKNLDLYRFIIFASDLPDTYYRALSAQRERLEGYVARGGVLEAHCAGSGWDGNPANLVMPGGMGVSPILPQSTNTVVMPQHPLAKGLPNRFDASFCHFVNLPTGARVITVDEAKRPTLVAYTLGTGMVLATGQPVEAGFIGNEPTGTGRVLMNMVAYAKNYVPSTWLSVSPTGGIVAPGDSLSVRVSFNAVGLLPGDYHCDVVVHSNDPAREIAAVPVDLHVTGAPDIHCPQTNIDCGAVCVGTRSARTITVENMGAASLEVSSLAFSHPEFTADVTSFTELPFSTRNVIVTFTPTTPGSRSGWLTFYCNDPDEPEVRVSLSGTGIAAPEVRVTPDSLVAVVRSGVPVTKTLSVSNAGGSDLSFSVVQLLGNEVPEQVSGQKLELEQGYMEIRNAGKDPEPAQRATEGWGGPDAFGYRWVDSGHPGGPLFSWVDITSVGTRLPMQDIEPTDPTPIGFSFPFYGRMVREFYACQKGFISFRDRGGQSSNLPLPNAGAPPDLIAAWWDNLYALGSRVYYYNDGSRLIIEYQDIVHATIKGSYTFEIILYPDGTIILQYLRMSGYLTSATVGIQNAAKNAGLQVVYNTPYMHDSLAVKLSTMPPSWLKIAPASGLVPPGGRVDLTAIFNPAGLDKGEFYSSLKICSNDPFDTVRIVPVHMTVRGVDVARLNLDPNTLNLGSHGKWIAGYIELPAGRDPADIKIETVALDSTVSVDPDQHCIDDYDGDGTADLMVKFPRSAVEALLPVGDSIPVTVSGELTDGGWFIGTDTIRVIRPHGVASPGSETLGEGEIQAMPWILPGWRGEHMFFQIAPNPATGGASVQLDLPAASRVTVKIMNAAGAVVKNVIDERLHPGRHNIAWTGRGERGEKLAPGVYFCVLKAGDYSATRKVILMR